MTSSFQNPRAAATLILVRDTMDGFEVCMVQRSLQASYLPGWHVFPGGALDAADSDPDFKKFGIGMNDLSASKILQLSHGGLSYWTAALRECFEEVGLLLAYDETGNLAQSGALYSLEAARERLVNGTHSFLETCQTFNLKLAFHRLVYFAHWITHEHAPRRFDTRFFAAFEPTGQFASHNNTETIDHIWIRPTLALERERSGEMKMAIATSKTIELLATFNTAEAFMSHVRNRSPASLSKPQYTN